MRLVCRRWEDLVRKLPWDELLNWVPLDTASTCFPAARGIFTSDGAKDEDGFPYGWSSAGAFHAWLASWKAPLRRLKLSFDHRDAEPGMLDGLTMLNELHLSGHYEVRDGSPPDLLMALTDLRTLDMFRFECRPEMLSSLTNLTSLRASDDYVMSDEVFQYLPQLRYFHCWNEDDTGLAHLRAQPPTSLEVLSLSGCEYLLFKDSVFDTMTRLRALSLDGSRSTLNLTDNMFAGLSALHTLDVSSCSFVTDAAFAMLPRLKVLRMDYCTQTTITDGAFMYMSGLHTLSMSNCRQSTITDAAFAHLTGLRTLRMSGCSQSTITDDAFSHLASVERLSMFECSQSTITSLALGHLSNIRHLDLRATVFTDEDTEEALMAAPLIAKHRDWAQRSRITDCGAFRELSRGFEYDQHVGQYRVLSHREWDLIKDRPRSRRPPPV